MSEERGYARMLPKSMPLWRRLQRISTTFQKRGYMRAGSTLELLLKTSTPLRRAPVGLATIAGHDVPDWGYWAPSWAIAVAGCRRRVEHRRRALLNLAATDSEVKQALIAAHMLGDIDAIDAMVAQVRDD